MQIYFEILNYFILGFDSFQIIKLFKEGLRIKLKKVHYTNLDKKMHL